MAIGFWENLTGGHLPNSVYFGASTVRSGKYLPSAFFGNTNDFATFLGLTFPFLISWLHYSKSLKDRFLSLTLLLGVFYLILTTGSRANIIAVFLEIAIFFFMLTKLKEKAKLAVGFTLIFALIFLSFPNFVRNISNQLNIQLSSFFSTYEMTVGSDIVRINLAKDAIYYLIHTFGFGVGAGNIEWNITNFSPYYVGGLSNVHNWWLEVLADYGIFIFAGFLFFYFKLNRDLWRIWNKNAVGIEKILCESLFLSLIGFSIASVSPSSIMSFEPFWLLFGFALAFLNYYRLKEVR
jgi:teichuronic acid biosynthesis protein TuaE